MVQAVSYNTAFDMVPAFAGLIADAMFTDKVSIPCGALAVPFGAAVFADPVTGRSVAADAAGAVFQGIAIHDHNMSGRLSSVTGANDGYVQYDSIAVMRRGRIWARVSTTITKDAPATSVAVANSLVTQTAAGAGFTAIPATFGPVLFLSANISIIGVLATDTPHSIAMLQLG